MIYCLVVSFWGSLGKMLRHWMKETTYIYIEVDIFTATELVVLLNIFFLLHSVVITFMDPNFNYLYDLSVLKGPQLWHSALITSHLASIEAIIKCIKRWMNMCWNILIYWFLVGTVCFKIATHSDVSDFAVYRLYLFAIGNIRRQWSLTWRWFSKVTAVSFSGLI